MDNENYMSEKEFDEIMHAFCSLVFHTICEESDNDTAERVYQKLIKQLPEPELKKEKSK